MPSEVDVTHGALQFRDLGDGRALWLYRKIYTFSIVIGPLNSGGYDDFWCYKDLLSATVAFLEWNPAIVPEPCGWVRHPPSGRRRFPDGDPATEEVRP
jgi:hypothetical protein